MAFFRSLPVHFALVILMMVTLTFLLILAPAYYELLSREDHLAEYLSALFLFGTSIFFLRSFFLTLKIKGIQGFNWRGLLFFVLAILFFAAGGEEVSWGQRIFGFQTPEYLSEINDQDELNFHNINKKFFDRVVDRTTIIFVLISSILLLKRKESILGIKLPELGLICAFAITPFYNESNTLNFFHLQYILFLFLLIYYMFKKERSSSIVVGLTLAISIAIPFVHRANRHLFAEHNNSANEYREFLFCFCCLSYAYVIFKNMKKVKQ